MSNITYTADDKVLERKGEFYQVDSCYTTPRSLDRSQAEYKYKPDVIMSNLYNDVDELTNKPRRFFDHLLSIVEYKRDHDPDIDKGNHREYWQHLIEGAELWLSAVNNGVYGEVLLYAQKVDGTEPVTWFDVAYELIGNDAFSMTPAEALAKVKKQ